MLAELEGQSAFEEWATDYCERLRQSYCVVKALEEHQSRAQLTPEQIIFGSRRYPPPEVVTTAALRELVRQTTYEHFCTKMFS